MSRRFFILVVILLLLTYCATTQRGMVLDQGEASWYGPGFHGNHTANGEIYDQNRLTAAHRTLPFNTVVRVVNLNNGKSVDVRINDRGPYARGRIIDLSREAARRIEMIESGTAPVRLILVSSEQPIRTSGPGNIRQEEFTIQLAAFHHKRDAEAYANQIPKSRVATGVVDGRTVYRVYYGRYRVADDARNDLERLKRNGHEGYIRQVQN